MARNQKPLTESVSSRTILRHAKVYELRLELNLISPLRFRAVQQFIGCGDQVVRNAIFL